MSKCQTEPMTLQILIEKECARMGVSDQEFTRLIGIKKFHKAKAYIEQVRCNQVKKMLPHAASDRRRSRRHDRASG